MRLLSALILTHCFGYVFPEDSDNEVEYKELYTFRSTENTLNCINRRFYGNQEENVTSVKFSFDGKYQDNNRQKIQCDYFDHGSIHMYPYIFAANARIYKYVQVKTSKSQIQRTKEPSILKFQQRSYCLNNSTNYGRKLLSYLAEDMSNVSLKNGINVESHVKIGRASPEETEEIKKLYNEQWDDWGNWSLCSATCGNGRRVRWRHCSADNCTKGLKKAQIKPCQLKKCDKNIFHWLGIKT